MGILNKIGKALGLTQGNTDEDDDLDAMRYSPNRTPYYNPFKKETEPEETPAVAEPAAEAVAVEALAAKPDLAPVSIDERVPANMLDPLVEIINSSLPKFIIDCLDIDAERKALFTTLSPQISTLVESMSKEAVNAAQGVWDGQQAKLMAQITALNDNAEQSKQKVQELKDKLANETAQRKAIVERSHTLESKVSSLEAEHEQLELEKKGLLNKIKVMEVNSHDVTFYRDEVDRLKKLNSDQVQEIAEAKTTKARLSELENEFALLQAEKNALAAATPNPDEIRADIEKQLASEYKEKMNLTNGLMNDLRQRVVDKDKEIKSLTDTIAANSQQIAGLEEELQNARTELEVVNEIQEELEKFEAVKAKKDSEIRQLKADLAELRQTGEASYSKVQESAKSANEALMAKNAEIESLKQRVEQQKVSFAAREADLNESLNNMRDQLRAMTQQLELADEQIKSLTAKLEAPAGDESFGMGMSDDQMTSILQGREQEEVPSFLEGPAVPKKSRKKKKAEKAAAASAEPAAEVAEPVAASTDDVFGDGTEFLNVDFGGFGGESNAFGGEAMPSTISGGKGLETVVTGADETPFVADTTVDFDDIDWLTPTPPTPVEPEPEPEPEPKKEPEATDGQLTFDF